MQFVLFSLVAALVSKATAQTPIGFKPSVEENLEASFLLKSGRISISPAGVLIPRADTAIAPALLPPVNVSPTGLFVAFMIDSDVPRKNSLTTLLQWFEPNLVPAGNMLAFNPTGPNTSTAIGAAYLQPSPPPGSGAHEYTLLLFTQPAGWIVPTSFLSINPPADASARIGFNISHFMTASGLGQPVAANYFRVLNGTAAETSSYASTVPLATVTTGSLGASTSTAASTTVMGTVSATPTASASGSASATPSTGGAADAKGNARELATGLAVACLGAVLWMA